MNRGDIVLDVRNFSISFSQYKKRFHKTELAVIKDLNVQIRAGEVVAVIGASGSGKSLLAHGILGLLPYNATMKGEMEFAGEALTEKRLEELRGREIALVPQSVTYLDPLMKTGKQLENGRRDKGTKRKVADALARFGLADRTKQLYPFELSGGMARRVLTATATMENPRLVIADEPTPGLHTEAAKRVLERFREMADGGAGVLLITHDLEPALAVADRIVVFYAGMTVEEALAGDFARQETLRHPYTRALWRAMPKNGFEPTGGSQPYAAHMPDGCPYAPRCELACAACAGEIPYLAAGGGYVRCVCAERGSP